MSAAKDKGTKAERATANALVRLGFAKADRGPLRGKLDTGDVAGVEGICIEVKDAQDWKTPEWMRETVTETANLRADFGILVIKAPGIGLPNAEKWLTVMAAGEADRLLAKAGAPRIRIVTLKKALGVKGYGWLELVQRERMCAPTPVAVRCPGRKMPTKLPDGTIVPYPDDLPPPWFDLMRLDARCSLLLAAGYR